MNTQTIHLFQSDPRFCGNTDEIRRVTLNGLEVTCPDCRIPDCNLCGQPMMLQDAVDDEDDLEQIMCGSPYPQWACFCNGGNYRECTGGRMPENWKP